MSKAYTVAKILDAGSRQAITTRYLAATDYHGGRIVAKCNAKRLVVPWDHALCASENHAAAAVQLHTDLGWHLTNRLVMGSTKDGYVFVQVPK